MPGFTFGQSGPNPNTTTARTYRWKILKLGPVTQSSISSTPAWYAKSLVFPTFGTSIEEVSGSSVKYKFASFTEFGNVSVSFYNIMNAERTSLNAMVEQWAQKVMGIEQGGNIILNQLHSADNYKDISQFALTKEDGSSSTKFTLHNSWPLKVSHSQLDYSKNELAEITVELVYDWISFHSPQTAAKQNTPDAPAPAPAKPPPGSRAAKAAAKAAKKKK